MKEAKYYLILAVALMIGLGLFIFFGYNRWLQMLVVVGLGVIYVLWGVVYHHAQKELYLRVILEYVAVAVATCLAVIFLLLRA
ncbi:hypothetical protein COU97_00165 [Candidatus Shapirobacteria bacterium CG10_big_fil_rev_8_21_14_0_10_48_15]|uniref:Uncharacterized protein n=1 Tax=Candidatus Shapirobacteria bacterium CG10_big_fil_rev_8_21_14_0_10_48_15 TaxID=1974484 RepID=A0A2M8L7Z3_9BACT|nr:MAG: hypothetical protein COU97_00165 [Candidatus Shapirobacteria bacterium CG10_big_fil_rev_8_21_14_0_10_48_15]